MKLIKKDGAVIMEAYEIDDFDYNTKSIAIDNFVKKDRMFYSGWFKKDIIESIKDNDYLFTKEGERIPINYSVNENGTYKTTLRIAGEEIYINIVNGNKKKVKQITVDVELKARSKIGIGFIKKNLKSKIKNAIESTEGAIQVSDLNYIDMTKEYKEAEQ